MVPDIIVATPGRMLDHIKRKNIDVYNVRILVVDEFDKALELGFQDEMERLVRKCQTPRAIYSHLRQRWTLFLLL